MKFVRPVLIMMALTWGSAAPAQDAFEGPYGVKARSFVEAEGTIYVGQVIRVFVEITTPTWFTKAPAYPELRLDGAVVLLPEQLGINFSNRVGSETRAGQRQRYVVIPQRAGKFEVPSFTVTLATAQYGKPTEPFPVTTGPLRFNVVMPPEAVGVTPLVTTASLSVEEHYDGSLENLQVGDALTRTVTIRATDTFGLALPPVRFETINGLAVYPAQAQIEDKVSRGQYSTVRTDAATYVLQEPGDFVLPAIIVKWWNPETTSLETRTLEAASISVAVNPEAQTPNAGGETSDGWSFETLKHNALSILVWVRSNIIWLTCIAGGLVLLRLVWRRFGIPLIASWRARRLAARQSEPHHFALFRRACLSGGDERITQAFWHWINRLAPDDQTPVLKQLVDQAGDEVFAQNVREVEAGRYSKAALQNSLRGLDMYRLVSAFRRHLMARRRQEEPSATGLLLNPRSKHS